jgi:hypothetical protein
LSILRTAFFVGRDFPKEDFMAAGFRFVVSILKIAIVLAIAGDLGEAVRIAATHAVESHQQGGVSFVKMNRMLQGQKQKCLMLRCK